MFRRLTALVLGHRTLILIATVLFCAIAGGAGSGVGGRPSAGGYDAPNSESARTAEVLADEFGRHPGVAARGSRNLSGRTWVIKRAAAVPGDPVPASVAATVSAAAGTPVPDGRLLVLGDNTTRSLDPRHYGYLSGDSVLGVVVRPPAWQPEHRR